MPLWRVTRTSTALSTSNDLLTIIAGASRPLRIWRVKVAGAGTSSVYNEVLLQRSTGGSGGGGSITAEKVDPATSGAASFTVNTTWSVQPSLAGGPLDRFGVNANGGIEPWNALPGDEIRIDPSGQISFRSAVGTSNVVISLTIED